jgi:hypothetical protein
VDKNLKMKKSSNTELLARVNTSNAWLHYKKAKPLWARELKSAETVETLEGKITYNEGDFLCKGPSGDMWGQKAKTLYKKYDLAPDSKPNTDGWQKFLPKTDSVGVMAASIGHDFSVAHPSWGTFHGKKGSYLVKSYEDKGTVFPVDIWIVYQKIFESTYEKV